eukprot:CAMPEP_0117578634 /NCGR_PEP_ID=MMETSP0784-20121206/64130_1 /TAXON_ID=39447 /ORGANISM="" /LENGTH=49 /DNA_ID= /DNA_START= /DNA_END= /DNA_ORIENTATION=
MEAAIVIAVVPWTSHRRPWNDDGKSTSDGLCRYRSRKCAGDGPWACLRP